MRSFFISIVRKVFPRRIRRVIKRWPYFLPGDYRSRLSRYENTALGKHKFSDEAQLSRLRLYAHILDKGLHREDWEPGHSVNTYNEAKRISSELNAESEYANNSCLKWVGDIVNEYEVRHQIDPRDIVPLFGERKTHKYLAEDLLEMMKSRTSSRCFKKQEVELEVVEKIAVAASEAPSSCNRQTVKMFATLTSRESVEVLKCFRGFTGFSEYVPCSLVFCVDLRPYTYPGEVFVPTLDAGLAVENAVLMASALGLSATQLSWGSRTDKEEKKLRMLLNIPEYYEVVVGAACGYSERESVRPVRKPVKDILTVK